MKTNVWNSCLTEYKEFNVRLTNVGRPTEIMIIRWLQDNGYHIQDFQNDLEKQMQGYDIVANEKKIEIKRDWKISQTHNFLGEWCLYRHKGYVEKGWLQHTIADYLFYYDGVDKIYVIDMWLFMICCQSDFKTKRIWNKYDKCYIDAYIMPIQWAKDNDVLIKTINLSSDYIDLYNSCVDYAKEEQI